MTAPSDVRCPPAGLDPGVRRRCSSPACYSYPVAAPGLRDERRSYWARSVTQDAANVDARARNFAYAQRSLQLLGSLYF